MIALRKIALNFERLSQLKPRVIIFVLIAEKMEEGRDEREDVKEKEIDFGMSFFYGHLTLNYRLFFHRKMLRCIIIVAK